MSIQDAWREAKKVKEQRRKERESVVKREDEASKQRKSVHQTLEEVGVNQIERCLRWAFGDDYGFIGMSEWPRRWNMRHPNIFVIYETDGLEDTFKRIGRAFQRELDAVYRKKLLAGGV